MFFRNLKRGVVNCLAAVVASAIRENAGIPGGRLVRQTRSFLCLLSLGTVNWR